MCDILPRTQSFFEDQQVEVSLLDDINTEASTVNHALHLVSEILPWVDNVQFPSFLQDSVIKRHFLSRDGLHLSFRATKYVADTITTSILKHLNHQEKDITTEIFSSPDSEFSLNNSPDSDSRLNSSPVSDLSVNSFPDSDSSVNSSPDSDLSVNSSPDSDLTVNSSPDSDLRLNSSPDSDLTVNSSLDSDLSVNSYPDSHLNSSIDSDYSLNSSPDSDLTVNSSPDSDLSVNSYPDSNLNSSIYSDSSLNSSPDSDLSVNSSLDSDLSVNSYPDSHLNSSIDSDSSLNSSQDSDLSVNTSPDSSNEIRLIGGGSENYEIKSGDTFSSFDEFRNKFEIWCQDKCFPMKIGGSEKLPNSSPAFPYKMVRYLCKHAGKPRSRGQAKRPVQQYLATGCEAVVRIHLDSTGQQYVVTKVSTEHNHMISSDNLGMYASNRTLNNEEISEIKSFLDMKVKTKEIKNYLTSKTGKRVITKDILNVKQKFSSEQVNGRTQGEILSDMLNEQTRKDPNGTTILQTDENNDFDFLFFQTSEMKKMFAKFPEMIFIDNTYNVCSEGYILNAILVGDQDGSGKPVAYCYMKRETKETLEKIIDDTSQINVIMVDKDLTEISILESKIPDAHIQICSFHVLKYFKTKVSKLDLKQDQKSELIQLLHQILYSHDEEVYTERCSRLRNEFDCFSKYFDDNWHSCREKRVRCYQKNVKNYGNFTNNKIESHNEKIKQYVSRNMHLPESLENLLKSVKTVMNVPHIAISLT